MNQLHGASWINRGKIVLLVGGLALFLGIKTPWYALPSETTDVYKITLNSILIPGSFLAASFLALNLISIFVKNNQNRYLRIAYWIGLIAVLLFPYWVTTWFPKIDFISTYLYEQGDSVTQHIHSNFPLVQSQWKQNIQLYQPTSIQSNFDFTIEDNRFFQISSWDRFLVEGLGYTDGFLSFIGKGWIFTLIGLIISLLAFYLLLERGKIQEFIRDFTAILPCIIVLSLTLCFSLVTPNIINFQLDLMFVKGQYHQVKSLSQQLIFWYPPLKGDQAFLQRMALAGSYSNEPDDALIAFVKGLEHLSSRDLLGAANYFRQSLNIQPDYYLARGYLAFSILREGVNYFNDVNGKKARAAADAFEEVLQIFPGHTEALYDLMIARTVNGEFNESATVAQNIISLQRYHQLPDLALLGQAYLHLSWAAYHNGNTAQAWKYFRNSVDESSWEKTDGDELAQDQNLDAEVGS
jgi:hypothetical protein